ncbi:MAG: HmuY family protein [Bacteroidales bacterium]|nr:HmuY family protein [Bacteroidales bacterium]
MKKFLLFSLISVSLALLAVSCKEPEPKDTEIRRVANLDASAYDRWVYFSFADGKATARAYTEAAPEKWEVAFHRENVRTNGGAALKTDFTALAQVVAIPAEGFVADVKDSIIVDMSQMMQGVIGYAEAEVNPALNEWVTRDGMPPVYTVRENVYIVRTRENTYAAIKFTSYKNDVDKTGYVSFDYKYPIVF